MLISGAGMEYAGGSVMVVTGMVYLLALIGQRKNESTFLCEIDR